MCFTGFALSRIERQPGTPEKPLSDLGRISYHSYWRSVVMEFLSAMRGQVSVTIDHMARTSGVHPRDLAETLQRLGLVRVGDDGAVTLHVDASQVERYSRETALKRKNRVPVDAECLRWTPFVSPHALEAAQLERDQVDEVVTRSLSQTAATTTSTAEKEPESDENDRKKGTDGCGAQVSYRKLILDDFSLVHVNSTNSLRKKVHLN